MTSISKEEREDFWKYMSAGSSFDQAHAICDRLLRENIHQQHELAYPLLVALIVLYGRPFKQRRKMRLIERMVPDELKETHDFLILLRDKMFAHADSDLTGDDNGESLNKVTIKSFNSKLTAGVTFLWLRRETMEKARSLCAVMRRKAVYQADKIWQRHSNRCAVPDGEYEVNLSSDSDDFFVPRSKKEEVFTTDGFKVIT